METPPPQFASYPRGQAPTDTAMPTRPPGVYFDYFAVAYKMVMKNAGVYVVGALLCIVISYAVSLPFSLLANYLTYGSAMGVQQYPKGDEIFGVLFKQLAISGVVQVIPSAFAMVLTYGIALCAIEEADTGSTTVNTLFGGFRQFWPVYFACLMVHVLVTLGVYMCLIPGMVAGAALSFAPIIAAKEGCGAWEAMRISASRIMPYILPMVGLTFVGGIVVCLGICACVVGLLVSLPVFYIVVALHYRDFRGQAQVFTP